ncbi:MAG TPA: TMEM165/GDT1 family protein [Allosphingosinicella sp.]|nr:TMEM165/GDT1 family protein [Allosphingosinicella sp.]
MDALLTTFIAAALAEFGDKTQLLVAALTIAYRRPLPIILGLALAALASALIAAAGGVIVHDMITLRASALLVALALLFAGATGLLRAGPPAPVKPGRMPAFLVAAICLFAAEMGDKTQFLTAALAARFDSFALAAAGATAGVIAANIPAALLGARYAKVVPLQAARIAIGGLFLLFGAIVTIGALRLA